MKRLIVIVCIAVFAISTLVGCTCSNGGNSNPDVTVDPNATETPDPYGGQSNTVAPDATNAPNITDAPIATQEAALTDITPFVGEWMGSFGDIKVIVVIEDDASGTLSYGDTELNVVFLITATTITVCKDDNTTIDVTYAIIGDSINIVYIGTTITFTHYTPPTLSDSLVGTWTGIEKGISVSYTFNADGSGSMTAMGIPMQLSYTVNGNTLSMTVSAFGDTDTAVATFVVEGNTLTMTNEDGESNSYTRG